MLILFPHARGRAGKAQRAGGTLAGFGFAALLAATSLSGCSLEQVPVIAAEGEVARTQRDLLFIAFGLMLVVLVPVWAMVIGFAWRYRASGPDRGYERDWDSSPRIEAMLWLVPATLIVVLGVLVWIYTHRLDPYRPVGGAGPKLVVQAVALDWKWLFIYPDSGIATVNELVVPAGRPVEMRITSDTVMNAFYVPGLAGQIYAMAGMETQLNFRADAPRVLTGRNMQYSGSGFPEQHFAVRVLDERGYGQWVESVRSGPRSLDAAGYEALLGKRAPSTVIHYASTSPGLFDAILARFDGPSVPGRR